PIHRWFLRYKNQLILKSVDRVQRNQVRNLTIWWFPIPDLRFLVNLDKCQWPMKNRTRNHYLPSSRSLNSVQCPDFHFSRKKPLLLRNRANRSSFPQKLPLRLPTQRTGKEIQHIF